MYSATLRVVTVVQALDIDQPTFLISLLSRVVKLAIFLQLAIVFGHQGFNLGVCGNVQRHRLEVAVLDKWSTNALIGGLRRFAL
jgi:hypothetical protein